MIEISSFDTVLFDVDETLVATSNLHEAAFKKVLEEFNHKSEFDYEDFKGMKTTQVFNEIGVPSQKIQEMTSRKQEIAGEMMANAREMYGASSILNFLKQHQKTLYAVSSGSKNNVLTSLTVTNLHTYISGYICGEDVRAGKPNPDCYLLALERFDLKSARVLAVEDSIAGCESALAANIRVIGISSLTELKCTARYSSLMEFLESLLK